VVRGSAEDLEGFTMIEIPEDEFSIEGAEENMTIGVDMTQYLPDGITVAENDKVLTFTAVIRKKPETSAETETSSVSESTKESDETKHSESTAHKDDPSGESESSGEDD
ncbi:MAG: hypothetical protein HUJ75_05970, partial [Parasporobacterium sp.]|nr:hypothetical protein [Parasporobacterium sp.]